MVSRIDETFGALHGKGEKALIAYIMAGDPDIQKTQSYTYALIKGGADIIELGMPFSDPIADGPVIQKAAQRALGSGTNISSILELVRNIRRAHSTPVILMGYFNPVFKYGAEQFFIDAEKSGVDGVILPDIPLEEIGAVTPYAGKYNIDIILLAAPTSGRNRLLQLSKHTEGFLYYISLTGVTGASKGIDSQVISSIQWLKRKTQKPVAVGFGISTPEQAAMIAEVADGVVVGSAFVKLIESHDDASNDLLAFAHALKNAIKE